MLANSYKILPLNNDLSENYTSINSYIKIRRIGKLRILDLLGASSADDIVVQLEERDKPSHDSIPVATCGYANGLCLIALYPADYKVKVRTTG